MMKNFVYKSIAVLILVLLIDFLVGAVFERLLKHIPDKNTEISAIYNSLFKKHTDILIMGPSSANHHYIPQILSKKCGLKVYNAGVDGKDVVYNYIILQSFTKRCKLKVAILDISPWQVNGHGFYTINVLKSFYGNSSEVASYYNDETGWQQQLKLQSHMYQYNNILSSLLKLWNSEKNLYNGFIPLYGTMDGLNRKELNSFVPDNNEVNHLKRIVEICKKNSIKLLFVESPTLLLNLSFKKWIKNFCTDNEVDLLDESSNDEYIENYFKDDSHMNVDGAKKFSCFIADRVDALIKSE